MEGSGMTDRPRRMGRRRGVGGERRVGRWRRDGGRTSKRLVFQKVIIMAFPKKTSIVIGQDSPLLPNPSKGQKSP